MSPLAFVLPSVTMTRLPAASKMKRVASASLVANPNPGFLASKLACGKNLIFPYRMPRSLVAAIEKPVYLGHGVALGVLLELELDVGSGTTSDVELVSIELGVLLASALEDNEGLVEELSSVELEEELTGVDVDELAIELLIVL